MPAASYVVQPFTANGGVSGIVQVASTTDFVADAFVVVISQNLGPLLLKVDTIDSGVQLTLANTDDSPVDLSGFLLADGARVTQYNQADTPLTGNTYVLRSGDTMTGPLSTPEYVKVGASTFTASAAGAGAIRYFGGNLQVSNGTIWADVGAGSGDVVGPASATDNAIARYDGTTGKLLQNSNVRITDVGRILAVGASTTGSVGLLAQNTESAGFASLILDANSTVFTSQVVYGPTNTGAGNLYAAREGSIEFAATGGSLTKFGIGTLNAVPLDFFQGGLARFSVTGNGTTGEMVVNDSGGNYDFRVEGDTNTDLLFVDASTDRIGIGTNAPGHFTEIAAGNLAAGIEALRVTGTLSSAAGDHSGTRMAFTPTGTNAAVYLVGARIRTEAGYTGTGGVVAVNGTNVTAGTGVQPLEFAYANFGLFGNAAGVTSGHNVGQQGNAANSTTRNYGFIGRAQSSSGSPSNIGVYGTAASLGGTPALIGGMFSLYGATDSIGTLVDTALLADNGATTSPIFLGRDNGTTVFTIADDSGVNSFGSSEVVFNDGGANIDFRVEGDTNANLLFVDASADQVGINAATPNEKLTVGGNLSLAEQASPPTGTVGFGKFFVKASDSLPYFIDEAGAEHALVGGSGGGDVVGPASATDNAIARYDGTTGKLLQNSSVTIDDLGTVTSTGTLPAFSATQSDAASQSGFFGDVASGVFLAGLVSGGGYVGAGNLYASATGAVEFAASGGSLTKFGIGTLNAVPLDFFQASQARFSVTGDGTTGEMVVNDSGGNYDFRVEGDTNANLLFVDASADQVGINAATPNEKLTIGGNLSLAEQASPPTGTAGFGKFFVKTSDSLPYFLDEAGAEHALVGGTGAGDVVGPASATDNAIARYDGTTGKLLQNSNTTIADSSGVNSFGSTEAVFNDSGANIDFRVEGDTNANLLFVDASTDRIGIGTSTPGHFVTASAGTLAAGVEALQLTATLSSAAGDHTGGRFVFTPAGSAAGVYLTGFRVRTEAGYTGTGAVTALNIANATAGTGVAPLASAFGNFGIVTGASGATVGHNVGLSASATNSSVRNIGIIGRSITSSGSPGNIGVYGTAGGGGTPVSIGGMFSLYGASDSIGTLATSALIADNAATANPIFLGRDNGTTVFTIADGGDVTSTATVNAAQFTNTGSLWTTTQTGTHTTSFNFNNTGTTISTTGTVYFMRPAVTPGAATGRVMSLGTAGTEYYGLYTSAGVGVANHQFLNKLSVTQGGSIVFSLGLNDLRGTAVFAPRPASSGTDKSFLIEAPAHTNQTASAETIDIDFNLNRTVQHATGAITTLRSHLVRAPTHSFVGASTITDAATMAITGPPVAGTNATITNPMALWVQSGCTNLGGAIRKAHRAISSSTSLSNSTDHTVFVDAASGAVTLSLPPAASANGLEFRVKKIDAANNVVIDPDGAETIDGAATLTLTTQYEVVTIQCDGTQWWVV